MRVGFIIILITLLIFGCSKFLVKNVVVKNIKTHTVQVTKLDNLYELGDTIIVDGVKSEVIRKKLKDGTVIKKGSTKTTEVITPPNFRKP